MRRLGFALTLLLCAGVLPAQAETLADIRQDLAVLTSELQRLKQELATSGDSGVALGGSALDRITSIEVELQRVTAKTEELGFRIEQVVKDGSNRLGDLEFRICEMEPGCDIGALGQTAPLGGQTAAQTPAAPPPAQSTLPSGGVQLAMSEETDFRAAQEAFAAGNHRDAAEKFATFRMTYPQGPLEAAALLGEGRALKALGDTREAARRFLDAYSGYPDAEVAPEALWRLGVALADLGSIPEACVTLQEVAGRYPGAAAVADAQAALAQLTCP
ncbi:MAG: tol-pal system protein YbgF [Paracoccaceae bacterium]|nr:tol-pal system protein YbgF [Paracoccaceae bacterium]